MQKKIFTDHGERGTGNGAHCMNNGIALGEPQAGKFLPRSPSTVIRNPFTVFRFPFTVFRSP
jgi:hypothetical protein